VIPRKPGPIEAGRRDGRVILAAAFLRAAATAMGGVLLGLHLGASGFGARAIGFIVGAGLAGNAAGTLLVGPLADRFGRRWILAVLAALAAGGGVAVAFAPPFPLLLLVAFVGMVNGMGRDRGAAFALEQAMIPATAESARRTRRFASYSVVSDVGHAFGSLAAGLPALLRETPGMGEVASYRTGFLLVGLLSLAAAPLYATLSRGVESSSPTRRLTPASRRVVGRLAGLYSIDSLAGGFLTTALLSYWFFRRFGVDESALGPLFLFARVANAASYVLAARLAEKIGLLRTMVFTHAPSSLLLMAVPFAPTFAGAVALFLARELLVEMDVPTRQAYTMALVRPEERPRASSVTNFVRTAGWSVAPALAGHLMMATASAAPLVLGGAVKLLYDAALYVSFRRERIAEEA